MQKTSSAKKQFQAQLAQVFFFGLSLLFIFNACQPYKEQNSSNDQVKNLSAAKICAPGIDCQGTTDITNYDVCSLNLSAAPAGGSGTVAPPPGPPPPPSTQPNAGTPAGAVTTPTRADLTLSGNLSEATMAAANTTISAAGVVNGTWKQKRKRGNGITITTMYTFTNSNLTVENTCATKPMAISEKVISITALARVGISNGSGSVSVQSFDSRRERITLANGRALVCDSGIGKINFTFVARGACLVLQNDKFAGGEVVLVPEY